MAGLERLQTLSVPLPDARLEADLATPRDVSGWVIFAHGSGSSRHSPRNRYVANELEARGFGTLLFDLLTPAEQQADAVDAHLRFDIRLLASRLVGVIDWFVDEGLAEDLPLALFGASTGAAAASIAAAERPEKVRAIVSRGGRPDLAASALPRVKAPTLLVVGALDPTVIELNQRARERLQNAHCQLAIVPGATHLFEEPGTLEEVAALATGWFQRFLA